MVNYLSKFLPNLSDESKELRELEKSNKTWEWNARYQHVFENLKTMIGKTETLKYFEPEKAIKIQCDASDYGLGTVLLQDEKPVYYASRSLTSTE